MLAALPRFVVVALLAWPVLLRAETLTLEQAVERALAVDERPKLALLRVERARALRREAIASMLPTLQFTGTYTRRPVEVAVQGPSGTAYFQRFNAVNGQALLEATLFDARAWPALDATAVEIDRQQLTVQGAQRLVAFDTADAFVAVLSAEELKAAAEGRVGFAAQALSDAQRRAGSGLASTNDVTRTELEASSAKLAVTQATASVKLARLSLGQLVGRDVTEALAVPATVQTPSGDLPNEAVQQRRDVQALEKSVALAKVSAQEPWLRLVPVLGLRAVGTATNESGFNPPTNGNIAATLTWVLFDGGVRYAQAAARAADVESAELSVAQLKRQVAFQVKTAATQLEAATAALLDSEARATLAEANAKAVATRFRSGLANAIEQVDAAEMVFDASTEVARQRLAVRQSQLALLEALGRWPSGAVNATLVDERQGAPK